MNYSSDSNTVSENSSCYFQNDCENLYEIIKEQNLDPESYQNFAKSIGTPVVYPRLKGLDKNFRIKT